MPAPRRALALSLAAVVLAAAVAPAARASATQGSVFEDDHLLLYSGDAVRDKTLDEIRALGATTIHAIVMWDRVAPSPNSGTRPAFDAADPNAYGGFGPWDALVAGAQARGLKVLLSPGCHGPAWASECTGSMHDRHRCSPRPSDYADFVHALGARYPSVHAWSFWNEPNHNGWLIPQTGTRNGLRVNLAAMRYRMLVRAGMSALAQTGHGSDLILIGETAPVGTQRSTAPVDFYRELFCLDRSYRPFRGAAARARGCSPLPRFHIGGVAHHPYTYGGLAAPTMTGRPADAPIGALGRITRVLDAAARYGIVPRRLAIHLTEFGFQTRPPDPYGMSLADQARWLNYSDFLAFRNPRVASVAQYTLRDDPTLNGFNTGLRFKDGRAKPALAAYALPIWVTRAGTVFGQVREADGHPVTVEVQRRARPGARFATVARLRTNAAGYFLKRFARVGGQWRLRYGARYSRVAVAG